MKRLRARRAEIGMSQEELARRAPINRSFLSAVELGKNRISITKAEQVAKALGLELSDMLASCCPE